MIIIAFEPNCGLGGYGDRIVGLISCKLISELVGQEFRIIWTKEDITPYFNYKKYEYIHDTANQFTLYDSIDRKTKLKPYLSSTTDLFPDPYNKFFLNQEVAEYLYMNTKFSDKIFLDDIYRVYKTLYTDIFVPTEFVLNKIQKMIPETMNRAPIIGIQIRAGDIYIQNIWWNGYKVLDEPQKTIPAILIQIKEHIDKDYPNKNYKVFLTSDYNDIYKLAIEVWHPYLVLYMNDTVQHMDRNPSGDFSKIFVDNYVLSQKTSRMYISEWSNYGRVAALSSIHNNIYNLKCETIEKSKLLSKG